MAMTERLAILITGDSKGAVNALNAVGKAADTDLVKAEKGLDRVGARMQSMGSQAVAAGAVMATAMFQAVQSTQDLADSWDKASATFGEGENGLVKYAEDAAVSMGKSKAAALDAASAYGLLLKGTGLDAPDLTKASTDLAVRTADLAEKYKKPFEEANQAISNAIKTGSTRALRGLLDYDIAISETDVANEAVTLGIARQGQALDRQQKALAISSLIMRESADAADTLRNSTDDVGVQIDVMRSQWENAKASFGEASLPVFTELANQASSLLGTFNGLDESTKGLVGGLATVATGALLTGGAVSVLAGSYLRLAAAQAAASGTAAAGIGPAAVAGVAVAVGAELALNNAIGNERAAAIDKAAVSQERFSASLATNDLNDLESAARDASAAISKGLDLGEWERYGQILRTTAADLANLELLIPSLNADDDDGALELANKQIDNFKASLAGVDPDVATQRIEAFVKGLEGGRIPAEELAKLQKLLNDEFGNTSPAADAAAKSAADLGAAYSSAIPSLNALAAALDGAGIPVEEVDAIMAKLDPTTASATVTLDQFASAAEAAGIPLEQLGAALESAGVKVETFASKQAEAAAKMSQASGLVIGYERALIRQEKAQSALDGLADKQADDVRTANDAVEDATDAVTDAIKRRTKAQQTLNDLNKKSAIAGSVPLLQEITRAAAEMESQAQAAARVAEATYGVGSDQAITANRAAGDAARRREQAGGFLNQALAEQQGRNAQDRADAADAVADADKAVSRASRDRANAQKSADSVLAGAALERKEAELDLIESSLGTVDAFGRLQAAIQDGATPVDTLRDGLRQAFDQGQLTGEQFVNLTGLLNGMAGASLAVVQTLGQLFLGASTAAAGGFGGAFGATGAAGGFGAVFNSPVLPGGSRIGPQRTAGTTINNYNISSTDPIRNAAEIAKRQKLAILERKGGR